MFSVLCHCTFPKLSMEMWTSNLITVDVSVLVLNSQFQNDICNFKHVMLMYSWEGSCYRERSAPSNFYLVLNCALIACNGLNQGYQILTSDSVTTLVVDGTIIALKIHYT